MIESKTDKDYHEEEVMRLKKLGLAIEKEKRIHKNQSLMGQFVKPKSSISLKQKAENDLVKEKGTAYVIKRRKFDDEKRRIALIKEAEEEAEKNAIDIENSESISADEESNSDDKNFIDDSDDSDDENSFFNSSHTLELDENDYEFLSEDLTPEELENMSHI